MNVATVAFSLYLVEAALLTFREVLVFELWWTSDRATAQGPAEADDAAVIGWVSDSMKVIAVGEG